MNRIPIVTKNLLAINVVMFLASFVAKDKGFDLDQLLGLHSFVSQDFHPYQLVTYMFMHGSLTHLFFNMFALYMFGRVLETVWGPKRFLVYYMIAGVGAGMVQECVSLFRYYSLVESIDSQLVAYVVENGRAIMRQDMNYANPLLAAFNAVVNTGTVGASGAIYAILLGFGMLFPNERMFIIPIPFPIKAKFFVLGYILIELYLGVLGTPDGVAHFAHLGGALFGFLLILYWRRKRKIGGPYA